MLVISRHHRFIFLHVPKCGGTSIAKALAPLADVVVPDYRKHATLDDCRLLISNEEIRSFRKVVGIRNTWDRIESGYWHQLRDPTMNVEAYLDVRDHGFPAFLRRNARQVLGIQNRWLSYQQERQPMRIIAFKRLREDFTAFCDEIGCTLDLQWLNRTDRRPDVTIYTQETIAMVGQLFAEEIAEFQFAPPPNFALGTDDETAQELQRERLVMSSDTELHRALQRSTSALDHARIADLAYGQGDFAAAAAAYGQAHGVEPENPWHLYAYAMSLRHAGDLSASRRAIDSALELTPQFPEALLEKAAIQSATGDDDGARATLEKAIEVSPSRAELHHTLSQILTRLNYLDDAMAAARRAIDLDPRFALPHMQLGFLYLGAGQPDRAVREMDVAADLAPEDPDARHGQSIVLSAVGSFVAAKSAILLALRARPDNPQYNRQLAAIEDSQLGASAMNGMPTTDAIHCQPTAVHSAQKESAGDGLTDSTLSCSMNHDSTKEARQGPLMVST